MRRFRAAMWIWVVLMVCLALSGCTANNADYRGDQDTAATAAEASSPEAESDPQGEPPSDAPLAALAAVESPSALAEGSSPQMPEFRILGEEKHDSLIKAQVVVRAIVSEEVTVAGLRVLLQELYGRAARETDFLRYHDRVTNVYVYLFTSEEYAASGYQWVAMLDKNSGDPAPNITVDEARLELYTSPAAPENRFGLAEDQRKEIFKEIVRIEDRALRESMERFPDLLRSDPGYSDAAFWAQIDRQMDEQERLKAIYKNALAGRHGLTSDELSDIGLEGMTKQWPMPAYEE